MFHTAAGRINKLKFSRMRIINFSGTNKKQEKIVPRTAVTLHVTTAYVKHISFQTNQQTRRVAIFRMSSLTYVTYRGLTGNAQISLFYVYSCINEFFIFMENFRH
jgi:hypothetical protein